MFSLKREGPSLLVTSPVARQVMLSLQLQLLLCKKKEKRPVFALYTTTPKAPKLRLPALIFEGLSYCVSQRLNGLNQTFPEPLYMSWAILK